MEEEWRDIPGIATVRLQASSLGRVRRIGPKRLARSPHSRPQDLEQKTITDGWVADTGYRRVMVGGGAKKYVHQLVCEAFHGPAPPSKSQVSHIDGDKLNNRPENLRWADWKDNRADGRVVGEIKTGEERHNSILTERDVLDVRELHAGGLGMREIGRSFGICHQHVGDIIRRRTWKHI